ncbi:CueP family metal-binding protein [Spiractinospora alimapuensis]|uniref:CueP family metal-binding protein n=1 Tax=Spiractinospora alimapuensis TaxID=2820884 RepID=UPI001F47D76A|nr:CueP family metal-binding protein [Spiractinospora alimapuensis]QVQ51377.1 CueP family metal-binding protein [Spiractinospora alimapuensis]
MSGRLVGALAVGVITLTGCSSTDAEGTAEETSGGGEPTELLAEHGLDGLDGTELVDRLDTMAVSDRPTNLVASVRPDSVMVSDGISDAEVAIDVPDDLFYVSVAPYVDQTHECYFHSLTTCLGELRDEEVEVTITDDATGEVLVEETTTTFDNGFVGYWLPRDIDATISAAHDGKSGELQIATGDEDPTCLTELRLA